MSCDMCGKKGVELAPLMESYKTDDIQCICTECNVEVAKAQDKIRKITNGLFFGGVKRFMRNRKQDNG